MKLEQLYSLIGSDMQAVDAVIRRRLHSEVVLVRQVAAVSYTHLDVYKRQE